MLDYDNTSRKRRRANQKGWVFAILTIATICYITTSQPMAVLAPIQRTPRLLNLPVADESQKTLLDYYRVHPPEDVPYVALTFDDAPSKYTEDLLDALEQMEVQATFFIIGERVEERHRVVERMDSLGHDIGNHTYSHAALDSEIPAHDVREILRCEQAIKDITGLGTLYIRPPFNALSDGTIVALGEAGYRFCLYDVDSHDFFTASSGRILENIKDVQGGDIIRLHDGHVTARTVKEIILALRKKGLEPVTLKQLVTVGAE